MPVETLVVVDPGTYPEFNKETIVDCNQVFELSREELVQKHRMGALRSHRDFPPEIMEKIWQGIRESPRVDDVHKRLIPASN